jgi:hypothetical protein
MADFKTPHAARIGRPLRRIRVEPKPEMPEPKREPKEPAKEPQEPKREPVPANA